MNFLFTSKPPTPNPPPGTKIQHSAQAFLQRIDALEEVTHIHQVWYAKHPDDKFTTLDEIQDEIDRSTTKNPVIITSKSGTLRQLAIEGELAKEKASIKWKSHYTPWRIWLVLSGFCRFNLQVFRAPFIPLFIYLSHIFSNYLNSLNLDTPTRLVLLIPIYIYIIIQIYTLFFIDESFARAFLSYQTKVRNGLYIHPQDYSTQNIAKNPKLSQILNQPDRHPRGWSTGDVQTLFPALLHDLITKDVSYIRRFLRNPTDNESIIMDVAFPYVLDKIDNVTKWLYHDSTKPILVLNHGLNGSSQAAHLLTVAEYYNKRGHTVCSINVRGTGAAFALKTTFVATRTSDIETLLKVIHVGAGNNTVDDILLRTRKNIHSTLQTEPQLLSLETCFKDNLSPMNIVDNIDLIKTPICATGFSLGGITLAHYCTRMGKLSGLTSVLAVCALAHRVEYSQAEHYWDPILIDTVKNWFSTQEHLIYHQQQGHEWGDKKPRYFDIEKLLNATSIPHFDYGLSTKIHGVEDFSGYCREIGFACDRRLNNLHTKLLIIHPENDPIIHIDCLYPAVQALLPESQQDDEFKTVKGEYYEEPVKNLIIFAPKYGGHIASYPGWDDKWDYLSSLSYAFNMAAVEEVVSPGEEVQCSKKHN
jgi:predicted alpha/beta-fold hydrolase